MKTFNQLLAEQLHVHPAMKTQENILGDEYLPDNYDTIASLKRSAQALEELILVKQTVLDKARVALSDLRAAIRQLEDR